MSNTELKPCPFCGSNDTEQTYNNYNHDMVMCKGCTAEVSSAKGIEQAIRTWNTRHTPDFQPDWDNAPEWATGYAIETDGAHVWIGENNGLYDAGRDTRTKQRRYIGQLPKESNHIFPARYWERPAPPQPTLDDLMLKLREMEWAMSPTSPAIEPLKKAIGIVKYLHDHPSK